MTAVELFATLQSSGHQMSPKADGRLAIRGPRPLPADIMAQVHRLELKLPQLVAVSDAGVGSTEMIGPQIARAVKRNHPAAWATATRRFRADGSPRTGLNPGTRSEGRQVTSLQFRSTRQDRRVVRKIENTSRDCLAFRGGLRLSWTDPGWARGGI